MSSKIDYIISMQDKISAKLDKIGAKANKTEGSITKMGKRLIKLGAGALTVGAFIKLGKGATQLAINMEQTEIAFSTFLGSAEKGQEVLGELNKFSNMTPFDNENVIKAGKSLLSANIPAEKLTETLKMIGDVASGTNVPLTDMANIYAKSMNKGKLQAEELNQLAERGVPIIDELAKMFNVTKKEVFDMASKGKITDKELTKVFNNMTKQGGKFFKLMEKQSKSTGGLLSTLQGKVQLLGIEFGKRFTKSISNSTKGLIKLADGLTRFVRIPAEKKIRDEAREVNALAVELTNTNTKEERRAEILERLNEINPDIVKGLSAENMNLEQLRKNIGLYNEQLSNRIILANLEEKEEKAISKLATAREKQANTLFKINEIIARTSDDIAFSQDSQNDKIAKTKELLQGIVEEQRRLGTAGKKVLLAQGEISDLRSQELQDLEFLSMFLMPTLEKQTRELGVVQEESLDFSERINQLKQILGLNKKIGDEINKDIDGGGVVSNVQDQFSKITAAAPKMFNINIEQLTGIENVNTTNITEGAQMAGNMVRDELLRGLNETQVIANQ